MAQKIPRQLAIGIAAGGALLIVAVAAFVILTKKPAHKPGDDMNQVGPDTVQLTPPPGAAPVKLASSGGMASPTSTAPMPSATTPEPVVKPQSAPVGPPARMKFEDKALKFEASFPGPASDPVISDRMKDAQGYLDTTKREAARAGRGGQGQWKFIVKWKETARAGDIVSLLGIASEDRAGAHPIQRFDTLIARTGDANHIRFNEMLMPDHSPSPALIIAICEGLKAEKAKRIHAATIYDEPIVCVGPRSNAKTDEALKLLAASSTPGKFGGAYIFYPPDVVGAYAEGAYDFVVPQSVFAADLRPDFKPLFAGDPKMPDLN